MKMKAMKDTNATSVFVYQGLPTYKLLYHGQKAFILRHAQCTTLAIFFIKHFFKIHKRNPIHYYRAKILILR